MLIASLTGQIAVEVAQFTEAKRKHHGKHVQPKVGLSPLQGGAGLRSTRSTSLRRQHNEKQAKLNAMKVNNFHLAMIKINHNHYALCYYVNTAFTTASGVPTMQATETSDRRPATHT